MRLKHNQARDSAVEDTDESSAIEQLIRPAMEAAYPVNLTRAMLKEALQCSDRFIDELTETGELPSIQRKRGKSGSRRIYPREGVIRYQIRNAKSEGRYHA